MGNLLWLAIPLVGLLVGIGYAYVISRPPRPAAMQDSMESFSRFRHALASHPGGSAGASRAPDAEHVGEQSVRETAVRETAVPPSVVD